MNKNPMCDGDHCERSAGEVRLLPGGDGNSILCNSCFGYELAWRLKRNKELSPSCKFALPTWDSLKVYPEGTAAPAPVTVSITFAVAEDAEWVLKMVQRSIDEKARRQGASAGILLDTVAKAVAVEISRPHAVVT